MRKLSNAQWLVLTKSARPEGTKPSGAFVRTARVLKRRGLVTFDGLVVRITEEGRRQLGNFSHPEASENVTLLVSGQGARETQSFTVARELLKRGILITIGKPK